jgi:hypothetical protein
MTNDEARMTKTFFAAILGFVIWHSEGLAPVRFCCGKATHLRNPSLLKFSQGIVKRGLQILNTLKSAGSCFRLLPLERCRWNESVSSILIDKLELAS